MLDPTPQFSASFQTISSGGLWTPPLARAQTWNNEKWKFMMEKKKQVTIRDVLEIHTTTWSKNHSMLSFDQSNYRKINQCLLSLHKNRINFTSFSCYSVSYSVSQSLRQWVSQSVIHFVDMILTLTALPLLRTNPLGKLKFISGVLSTFRLIIHPSRFWSCGHEIGKWKLWLFSASST